MNWRVSSLSRSAIFATTRSVGVPITVRSAASSRIEPSAAIATGPSHCASPKTTFGKKRAQPAAPVGSGTFVQRRSLETPARETFTSHGLSVDEVAQGQDQRQDRDRDGQEARCHVGAGCSPPGRGGESIVRGAQVICPREIEPRRFWRSSSHERIHQDESEVRGREPGAEVRDAARDRGPVRADCDRRKVSGVSLFALAPDFRSRSRRCARRRRAHGGCRGRGSRSRRRRSR